MSDTIPLWEQTLITQYDLSPTIRQIVKNFQDHIDPAADLDAFYNLIWNVDTAVGYGLDVWGRIVGVGRVIQLGSSKYFGFEEATTLSADPFNQSPFYTGQTLTTNFLLSDDGFRTLIFAKALANICDGSIPAINQILLTLFPGRGNVYVVDNADMTIDWTFGFEPTALERTIVELSGVLPKPCGVTATTVIV